MLNKKCERTVEYLDFINDTCPNEGTAELLTGASFSPLICKACRKDSAEIAAQIAVLEKQNIDPTALAAKKQGLLGREQHNCWKLSVFKGAATDNIMDGIERIDRLEQAYGDQVM
jgi:hypothetical protein